MSRSAASERIIENRGMDQSINVSGPKVVPAFSKIHREKSPTPTLDTSASASDESITALRRKAWGKHGKTFMWIGIALMYTIFELDHTTFYNYQQYAMSQFEAISALGALTTAGTIVQAILKPPLAKISDIAGRAETYCVVVVLYIVSYTLTATSRGFSQYAGGYLIYCIGATGMQILNQVIVADITSARWRGLANALVTVPFMIIPWIAAFISDGVIREVGWRWGIGILAIILPVSSIAVIAMLFVFQHQLVKFGGVVRSQMPVTTFFSNLDLGGLILLGAGLAMLLIPFSLAGDSVDWKEPWVPILMTIGALSLILLSLYETKLASHPILPTRFFSNRNLLLSWSLGLLDAFAYNVTHTYLYAWSTVVHSFSARNASFLTYTTGSVQVATGLLTGYLMFRTRHYKWLLVIGVIVRLVGYGIMLRLRGADNSVASLFIIQIIQGAGSGVVGTVILVVAQVCVPHSDLAHSTALELLFIYLGQALGSAVAGAIYTNLFKPRLRHYTGPQATETQIDNIFSSITDTNSSRAGQMEEGIKTGVNSAYSDILRYMTIAALAASALPMVGVWFVQDLELRGNRHNLVDTGGEEEENNERVSEGKALKMMRNADGDC